MRTRNTTDSRPQLYRILRPDQIPISHEQYLRSLAKRDRTETAPLPRGEQFVSLSSQCAYLEPQAGLNIGRVGHQAVPRTLTTNGKGLCEARDTAIGPGDFGEKLAV